MYCIINHVDNTFILHTCYEATQLLRQW